MGSSEPGDDSPNVRAGTTIVDLLFFRAVGAWLLYNEATLPVGERSDWELIVAALCMFFMPDAIRGRNSVPAQVIKRLVEGNSRE